MNYTYSRGVCLKYFDLFSSKPASNPLGYHTVLGNQNNAFISAMVRKCIFLCTQATRLYRFPSNDKLRKKWCQLLSLKFVEEIKKYYVCNLHFDQSVLNSRKLSAFMLPEQRRPLQSLDKDNGFETVYIDMDVPKSLRVYKTPQSLYCDPEQNAEQMEKLNCNNISETKLLFLDPVDTTFKRPPKRTYSHGTNIYPKSQPQLDITATCYCRCHKGEDRAPELQAAIERFKQKDAVQEHEMEKMREQLQETRDLLQQSQQRIAALGKIERKLNKTVDSLTTQIKDMCKWMIRPSATASKDSITFARMACDGKREFTDIEMELAFKLFGISEKCYKFLRDIFKLNLPHPTKLISNPKLMDTLPHEYAFYADNDEAYEIEETIVYSPQTAQECDQIAETEYEISVDV